MKKLLLAVLVMLPMVAVAEDAAVREHADEMFSECDTNGDGKISKAEFDQEKATKFSEYDKNKDGALSKDEHAEMAQEMHQKMKS